MGFRGDPRLAVVHILPLSSRPYAALLKKWKAFRNHRNVMYWERRGGESEKRKIGETRRKGGFEVAIDSFERSVGFRGDPWGSVGSAVPVVPTPHYPSHLSPVPPF